MNRFLLLILLTSWSTVVPLSLQCETGIAYAGHVLSISHSLMANADVALLKTYQAEDVNTCMTDCCTEKFGSCTVVSFKKNTTENSCTHFNCRPVTKCRYLSSNTTDSFSFSSSPLPAVPSGNSSAHSTSSSSSPPTDSKSQQHVNRELDLGTTKEAIATYSEEQFAVKNDNTTIKPRKGVYEVVDTPENVTRKGIKPRKGVTLDDTSSNDAKSNVKPRKGVVAFVSATEPPSPVNELSTHSTSFSNSEHSISSTSISVHAVNAANDLISALEKVFEDDPNGKGIKSTSTSAISNIKSIDSSPTTSLVQSTATVFSAASSVTNVHSSSGLQSSYSSSSYARTSTLTPDLVTATAHLADMLHFTVKPSKSPSIFEHSKLIFHESSVEDSTDYTESEESEKERKYKSSMHLVLSLVFGLLVLFTVLGVVAKRVYDGWMRRHYRRMDFLIDGMYNGYG